MEIDLSKFYRALAPRPAVLISTIDKDGNSNAAPFSFVSPVSLEPPLVLFCSQHKHDTLANTRATGEFVINMVPEGIKNQVYGCSRKLPAGESEIRETGLKEKPSEKVGPPGVAEGIGWFECKVLFEKEAGDHVIVVGEVLRAEVRDEFAKDGFDLLSAKPLMHVSGREFTIAERIIYAE